VHIERRATLQQPLHRLLLSEYRTSRRGVLYSESLVCVLVAQIEVPRNSRVMLPNDLHRADALPTIPPRPPDHDAIYIP
jgi:hypothetical protein